MNFVNYSLYMAINYLNIKKLFSTSPDSNEKVKSNISISSIPETPKIILIIFPIQQDFFRVASYSYRNLPYDKDKIEFHYIVDTNFIESFSLRRGMVHKMNLDNKLRIINKNDLLLQLSKINFDIIIDLNISYESSIEDFIAKQSSNYKIGFKHDKSDSLYNVQLDISKSQIAEKGYQQILDLI